MLIYPEQLDPQKVQISGFMERKVMIEFPIETEGYEHHNPLIVQVFRKCSRVRQVSFFDPRQSRICRPGLAQDLTEQSRGVDKAASRRIFLCDMQDVYELAYMRRRVALPCLQLLLGTFA